MKILVNGGLNCSVLDGWWAEAYKPAPGWAIGEGHDPAETDEGTHAQDAAHAERLYTLLQRGIIPEFYDRDAGNIPQSWTARVRESRARLKPKFSANRSVRRNTEEHYIPAATQFHARSADNDSPGGQMAQWQRTFNSQWPDVRCGPVSIESDNDLHTFTAQLSLGRHDPAAVHVELFANAPTAAHTPVHTEIKRQSVPASPPSTNGTSTYIAQVRAKRPVAEYTARVLPFSRRPVAAPTRRSDSVAAMTHPLLAPRHRSTSRAVVPTFTWATSRRERSHTAPTRGKGVDDGSLATHTAWSRTALFWKARGILLIAGIATAGIAVHLVLRFVARMDAGVWGIPLWVVLAVGGVPLVD